ncbi:Serine protease Do-like HtrA [Planctomycetes bacterium MalM25]|nr:Serine protease Do-like HtrA [Planctomycetes bacterium MalM25]
MVLSRFVLLIAALAAAPTLAQQAELLDFYTPTCGPCQAMRPTVDRLEAEGVRVRRIDGSRQPQLVARMRVEAYPTFIAVVDGREVKRIVGATSYDQLKGLITAAKPAAPSSAAPASRTFAPTVGRGSTLAAVGGDFGAGQPAPVQAAPAGPAGQALLSQSVRLTITEGNATSYGTGTIVDSRAGEALVVTCAHLFRDASNQPIDTTGRLKVELFDASTGTARVSQVVEAQLVSHDFEADVALVAIRPQGVVQTAAVGSSVGDLRTGDAVTSVGCDLGADPTVREHRVVDLDRYQGPPNVEASGAPIQGRSGGGLFDASGRLVGVCNFADKNADEGIYAGLASIHAQLDRIGMSDLYRGGAAPASPAAAPAVEPEPFPIASAGPVAAPAAARGLEPIAREPVVRGQNAIAPPLPPAAASLTSTERATLGEIASRASSSEVVVLIHPEGGGRTEVLTLDSASPEFVAALRKLNASR